MQQYVSSTCHMFVFLHNNQFLNTQELSLIFTSESLIIILRNNEKTTLKMCDILRQIIQLEIAKLINIDIL